MVMHVGKQQQHVDDVVTTHIIINIAKECCTLHPETTAEKLGVEEGGTEDGDFLEGLRELEPEEGVEDGDGVVEEVVVQLEAASASSSSSLEHVEGETNYY